ncbi:hypothetical protein J6590_058458 [Homalodisca vitripennis]|nr:hypothetical protein J6590_058458 [Homalodisca vitripennis]
MTISAITMNYNDAGRLLTNVVVPVSKAHPGCDALQHHISQFITQRKWCSAESGPVEGGLVPKVI